MQACERAVCMRSGCAYVLGALACYAWCAITPPGSRTETAAPDQDAGDVSNSILQNTFYQSTVLCPPRRTESLKEPIIDGIIDKVLERRRWVSGSQNYPIIRGRQAPNSVEDEGSTTNVSKKRYNNTKRKCSFSSFNECRYWEDDGKTTTTYFFPSDTVPMKALRNDNCMPDTTIPPDKNEIRRPPFKMNDDDGVTIPAHKSNSSFRKAMKRQVTNI